jgi:hypothetical protein
MSSSMSALELTLTNLVDLKVLGQPTSDFGKHHRYVEQH